MSLTIYCEYLTAYHTTSGSGTPSQETVTLYVFFSMISMSSSSFLNLGKAAKYISLIHAYSNGFDYAKYNSQIRI